MFSSCAVVLAILKVTAQSLTDGPRGINVRHCYTVLHSYSWLLILLLGKSRYALLRRRWLHDW